MAAATTDSQLLNCISRYQVGDAAALNELIGRAYERMRGLTRKLLRTFPAVRRWDETDDVLQNVWLRLLNTLQKTPPGSVREFFALSARAVRRELLDLKRHYCGPEGMAAHHSTNAGRDSGQTPRYDRADDACEPSRLAEWFEFHERVDQLPDHLRAVIDLVYYHGATQAEAAEVLGVTVRTVRNRRDAALLKIREAFRGERPVS